MQTAALEGVTAGGRGSVQGITVGGRGLTLKVGGAQQAGATTGQEATVTGSS